MKDATYSCRVRMSCAESRRAPRCSVDVVAFRLRDRGAWRISVRPWDRVVGRSTLLTTAVGFHWDAMFAHIRDIEKGAVKLPLSQRKESVSRSG